MSEVPLYPGVRTRRDVPLDRSASLIMIVWPISEGIGDPSVFGGRQLTKLAVLE